MQGFLGPDEAAGIEELLRLIERTAVYGGQSLFGQFGHVFHIPNIIARILERADSQFDLAAILAGVAAFAATSGAFDQRRLCGVYGVAALSAGLASSADASPGKGDGDPDAFFSATPRRDCRRAL